MVNSSLLTVVKTKIKVTQLTRKKGAATQEAHAVLIELVYWEYATKHFFGLDSTNQDKYSLCLFRDSYVE